MNDIERKPVLLWFGECELCEAEFTLAMRYCEMDPTSCPVCRTLVKYQLLSGDHDLFVLTRPVEAREDDPADTPSDAS